MSSSVPVTHDPNQLDPTRYPGDANIIAEHPELAPQTADQKQSAANLRTELEQRAELANGWDLLKAVNTDATDTLGQKLTAAVDHLQQAYDQLQKDPRNIATERAVFLGRVNAEKAAQDALIHDAKHDLHDLRHIDGNTVEVKLKTGEVFRGSPLEVVSQMADAHVNTKRWAQGIRAENEQLREHRDNPIQQPLDTSQPIDASGITPDHIAKAMGFSNGTELLQFGNSLVEMQQDRMLERESAIFYSSCPDYPATPESEKWLLKVMEQAGLPETAAGMAAAHSLALRAGYYAPLPKEAYEPQSQANTRPAPPPPTPGGGTAPQANPQDIHTMPIDQLRMKLLKTPFRSEG